MSWTSEWLRDWLEMGVKRRTQAELATLAGVDPANVSRYLSGQNRPDGEVISRMISNLGQDDAERLVIAWLMDLLPPNAKSLVRILPNAKSKVSEPEEGLFLYGMGKDLKHRLEFFGKLAMVNPDIRKIIDVCYDAAQRGEASQRKP